MLGCIRSFPVLKAVALAVTLGCLASCGQTPPQTVKSVAPPQAPRPMDASRFARIDEVARQEIASRHICGAVVLVGRGDEVVYRQAFGSRSIEPRPGPMTEDTIFDIASLTKVVATTTAVMQLVDRGSVCLDDPAATWWPAFGANGKGRITLRQLLTHTSGLRPDLSPSLRWTGYDGALSAIAADRPVSPPGRGFRYSDINFIVLGEIVRRASGLPLEAYCEREIFKPLSMHDTCFRPSTGLQCRIAPSDVQNGRLRWGEVQDPTAYRMGGAAGHAGVFSTAEDLALFARMLLNGGMGQDGQRILSQAAVAAMTKPYPVPGTTAVRGLGWDIRSPYSKEHTRSFPAGSFGHTGYTGTSLWIDPRSGTFLIILTNRLHPSGKGQVKAMREQTAAAVAAAIPMGPPAEVQVLGDSTSDPAKLAPRQSSNVGRVKLGIDVLAASRFAPLVGRSIGVITNQTGVDSAGRSTLGLLLGAPGIKVKAIFSPEHGLSGNLDRKISSGKDPATGLPVFSLYGDARRPTAEMLRGLDALVYDIQDVGARFYTYITTMAYAMEAAAAAGLDFFVLDRPDPISASVVQGPVMDPDLKSFVGYCPLPVRYGMTAGELAGLFNVEGGIGARLHVVPMEGYRRGAWLDEAGLPWVNPSPNIRSLTQAALYPGVALVESANVSVGRGTDSPFELMGAPWISGDRLARYLRDRHIAGIAIEPAVFVPAAEPFRNRRCEGVRLRVVDRAALDAPALGVEMASALRRLYPAEFQIDRVLGMIGARDTLRAIKSGDDPRDVCRGWKPGLDHFLSVRRKYLLY